MNNDSPDQSDEVHDDERMTLSEVIGSVMAAGFGVQSPRNRERDFACGLATQFIVVGVIFTLVKIILAYAAS